MNTYFTFARIILFEEEILPISSSLESEDSSLEVASSDFETRILTLFCTTGTVLWMVTHSRGLSTFATWISSCCRSLSALVKLLPQVAQICSFVWSWTSRICLRNLQSSVNSFGHCCNDKSKKVGIDKQDMYIRITPLQCDPWYWICLPDNKLFDQCAKWGESSVVFCYWTVVYHRLDTRCQRLNEK